jgi:hypothetical protein
MPVTGDLTCNNLYEKKLVVLKQLAHGDLIGELEPTYLASEKEVMDETENDEPVAGDTLVLSILTDRPTNLDGGPSIP